MCCIIRKSARVRVCVCVWNVVVVGGGADAGVGGRTGHTRASGG